MDHRSWGREGSKIQKSKIIQIRHSLFTKITIKIFLKEHLFNQNLQVAQGYIKQFSQ